MLMKYIETSVHHKSKSYNFYRNNLEFDKDQSSIILPINYIKTDIENYKSYVYMILDNMVKSKIYASQYNVERAIKTGSLIAQINITYCTDINKCDNRYSWGYSNIVKNSNDVEKYCSGVRYYYDFKTKEISRYEVYGDIVLGDEIHREESYYNQFKFNII